MKKKAILIFQYAFFLALGIFLVWWQFDKMTPEQRIQFGESLRNADYRLLIPIIILSILSHVSRAVRWKIMISPMGYKPSTRSTFYAIMCGYVANLFLPRAGEIIKCSLLGRHENIPVNKLVGTIIVERAFDFICYVIFIFLTIIIQVKLVSAFVKDKVSTLAQSDAAIPAWIKIIFVVVVLVLMILTLRWSFKRYAERKVVQKIKGFTQGLREGFNTITRLEKRAWFIAHTFFIWAMYLLQIYIGFYALTATSHLGMKEACSVLSLATLAMIVSPGGIGAFPIAVQEVLLIYKIDNISFGWLIWGVSTAIVIVLGLLSFLLLINKPKKLNETGTEHPTEDLPA